MAIKYTFLDDGVGIEIVFSGVIHGRDIINIHKEINSTENLSGLKYKIIDRTQVKEFYVSAAETKEIARLDKETAKIKPDLAIAIISPSAELDALAGLWEANLEGESIKTNRFFSRNEAEDWIKEILNQNH